MSQEGLKVYIKDKDDDLDAYRVGNRPNKQQKKKEDKYELVEPDQQNKPYRVEQNVLVYKKTKKKKTSSAEEESSNASKRERIKCGCQARLHQLVNNCVRCGRIVCVREGPGPCFHCGHEVRAILGGDLAAASDMAAVAALERGANQQEIQGLQRAQEHLGKLLEYDQNAVRRTTVYDDQADYFDMSKWLSEDERKNLREKEEAIFREKEARKRKVTIDFAGRKVVSEEAEALKFEEEIQKQIIAGEYRSKPVDPNASLMFQPKFVEPEKSTSQPETPAHEPANPTKPSNSSGPAGSTVPAKPSYATKVGTSASATPAMSGPLSSRVQHEYYPEIADSSVANIDFDQLVAADKTDLTQVKEFHTRGVLVSKPIRTLADAKPLVAFLAQKKANFLISRLPKNFLHSLESEDAHLMKQLNAECRQAGIKLCVGVPLIGDNFDFASEEQVAKMRAKIFNLIHKDDISSIAFFFSEDLSAFFFLIWFDLISPFPAPMHKSAAKFGAKNENQREKSFSNMSMLI